MKPPHDPALLGRKVRAVLNRGHGDGGHEGEPVIASLLSSQFWLSVNSTSVKYRVKHIDVVFGPYCRQDFWPVIPENWIRYQCGRCDVRWHGNASSPCWNCESMGAAREVPPGMVMYG